MALGLHAFSDREVSFRLVCYINKEIMKINRIIPAVIKWLRYITIAYMLGFANVLNQEIKTMDDTLNRIEQTSEEED